MSEEHKYSPELLAHYGVLCADCPTRKRLIDYTECLLEAVDNSGKEVFFSDYAPDGKTELMLYIKAVKP